MKQLPHLQLSRLRLRLAHFTNRRNLLVALGVVAIAWPFILDQSRLSCALSPEACANGEETASTIILISFAAGSTLISNSLLLTNRPKKLGRVLGTAALTAGLAVFSLFAYALVVIQRYGFS